MIFRLRIALAVLWLSCSVALSAQIGFHMPFVNDAAPGSNKNMTVKVTNFDSIASMQYVIRWNPAVLKYLTIDNFGVLPGLDLLDFNVQNAVDSGFIRVVWEGPNSFPGVSVADSSTIFRIRFNVIGADTSSTFIRFTEINYSFPTTDFEVVKVVSPNGALDDFDEHECSLTHGFIAVGYSVASHEPTDDAAMQLAVSPNPFTDNTKVEFSLEQTEDVQITVTDATRRVVFQQPVQHLSAGKHQINLEKAYFPAKGAYFLLVRAGSKMSVRPIICN
jgi:hypothetical protein